MGQLQKIFTALSAGTLRLLPYPGIFSGLSNDGKRSPALFITLITLPSLNVFINKTRRVYILRFSNGMHFRYSMEGCTDLNMVLP